MNILYIVWNPFQSALHNNSAFKILDSLSQNIVILLGKGFLYFSQVTSAMMMGVICVNLQGIQFVRIWHQQAKRLHLLK